jgi:hypothetical protein
VSVGVIVFVVLVIAVGVVLYRRKFGEKNIGLPFYQKDEPPLYKGKKVGRPASMELQYMTVIRDVNLGDKLGSGNFGKCALSVISNQS